jgi:hypothetical protein
MVMVVGVTKGWMLSCGIEEEDIESYTIAIVNTN